MKGKDNQKDPGLCHMGFSMVFLKMMSLKRVYMRCDCVSGRSPHNGESRLLSSPREYHMGGSKC